MPVDYCFSPNYVIVQKYDVFPAVIDPNPGAYDHHEVRFYFNTNTLVTVYNGGRLYPEADSYTIDTNTLVNAKQSGTDVIVYKAVVSSGVVSIVGTNYANRRLLSVKVVDGSPVDDFEIKMFNMVTKDEEVLSCPTIVPCYSTFIFNEGLGDYLLATQCLGYIQEVSVWDPVTETVDVEMTENSVACGYIVPSENTPVTEVKRIKVITDCVQNPVMLVWKNNKGGWDRWLFGQVQTISRNTESFGRIEKPYFDLGTLESKEIDLGKIQTNFMTLGAQNLTRDEKNGIEKIMVAPLVYKITKSGEEFIKEYVKVLATKWTSEETDAGSFSIEFQIELPETFSIQ